MPDVSDQNKRRRVVSKAGSTTSASSTSKESSSYPLGLRSLLGHIPTREDPAAAEVRAAESQTNMTSQLTQAMSSMITTNKALELASREKIAYEEMNVTLRKARGQMIVDLVHANVDIKTEEAMANEQMPDVQAPNQNPQGPWLTFFFFPLTLLI